MALSASLRAASKSCGGSKPATLRIAWCWTGAKRGDDAGHTARAAWLRERVDQAALPYQLKATTTLDFEPDGVHCTIILPLANWRGRDRTQHQELRLIDPLR
jgi:hypothetical protein